MIDDIFCKIINDSIPAYKVYEDEDVIAILDISQTTKGHTLIIPKKHFKNILDVDLETLNKVMKVTQLLALKYQDKLHCQGFNILNNCHEVAGQTVNHLHFHLIPRYDEKDTINIEFTNNKLDLATIHKIITE